MRKMMRNVERRRKFEGTATYMEYPLYNFYAHKPRKLDMEEESVNKLTTLLLSQTVCHRSLW